MANDLIQQVQIDNEGIANIASTAYGVCSTAANTAAKVLDMAGFTLITGITIHVRFTYGNSAVAPTLNVNATGAKPIVLYSNIAAGTDNETSGWQEDAIVSLTYDGTSWVRNSGYNTNDQVYQTSVNANGDFYILLKNNSNTTNEMGEVHYNTNLSINPSTGILSATGFSGSGAGLTDIPATAITGLQNLSGGFTIAGRSWNLGDTITAATLRSDLGLSNAMHFIGVATVTITEGSNTDPVISNYTFGTNGANAQLGDVIIDSSSAREYVWTDTGWELLGQDASTTYDSNAITASNTSTNTWISRIQQNSDRTISIERTALDTTGLWSGTAGTANAWTNARKVYVDLSTASTTSTINGSSSANAEAIGIGVDGTLGVPHGGTGLSILESGYALIGNGTSAVTLRLIVNNNSATAAALDTTNNSLVTVNTLYYALPTINNARPTSDVTIYAPVDGGAANHILVSTASNTAPIWTDVATLSSESSIIANAQAYDVLTLGNNASVATTNKHSEGYIVLYSSLTGGHTINGTAISTDIEHTLPNQEGWLAAGPSAGAGSNTQPVYMSSSGILTGLTYTPNRLYYSDAAATGQSTSTDFLASGHYANATKIAINSTTEPNQTFYVDGTVEITGRTGIGTGQDNSAYLTVLDYFKIVHNSSDLVHLAYETVANEASTLYFYPETDGNGWIGKSANRWKLLYLSDSVNLLDNSNNSATLTSSGTLTLVTANPTITLDTTTVNASTWTIINTAGVFSITDSDDLTIDGTSDKGFTLAPRLYINSTIDNNTTYNFLLDSDGNNPSNAKFSDYVGIATDSDDVRGFNEAYLVVQDWIKLVHDSGNTKTDLAHLLYDSTDTVQFYPHTDKTGMIGLSTKRWNTAYFSEEVNIIDDNDNGVFAASDGTITITAATPTITLNTTVTSGIDWALEVASNVFWLSDSNGNTYIKGIPGSGFRIDERIYINADIPVNPDYRLYVNGDTYTSGALYLGNTTNDYGAYGLPIYWGSGLPTPTYPIQYATWTIASGTSTVTLTSTGKYFADTYVIALVVTSGEANLNGPITWTSDTDTLTLTSTTSTSGDVSGYVITARGDAITIITPTPQQEEEPT